MSMSGLQALPNLGATVVARLGEVGIETPEDLRRIGPVAAYLAVQASSQSRLPYCYYLYSLDAALRGHDWRDLPDDRKRWLRHEVAGHLPNP